MEYVFALFVVFAVIALFSSVGRHDREDAKKRESDSHRWQLEAWKSDRARRKMGGGGNSAWDTAAFNLAKKRFRKT